MKPLELTGLMDHMHWADAALWTALLGCAGAREDGRTRELVYHVHLVQSTYLQMCRGEGVQLRSPEEFPDLAALCRFGRDTHAAFARFIVSRPAPGTQIHFPWADQIAARFGTVHPASISDGLLQVTSHTTYHRGQVNARLRELGGEPASVDYIAWVWAGRPDAEWPEP